jgi:DNA-binding NtrC family response regulator
MTADNKPSIILLVEDEALVRMLASDILTDEGGYRVIEAVNADEALKLMEARPDVRLLFTDVDMPGSINGFGLARVVDMRWPGVSIIVASGQAGPGVGDLPRKAKFIAKPYSPSALLRLVRECLGEASPIVIPASPESLVDQAPAVLPTGIKVAQQHTGLGVTGGLAQPLPEADE